MGRSRAVQMLMSGANKIVTNSAKVVQARRERRAHNQARTLELETMCAKYPHLREVKKAALVYYYETVGKEELELIASLNLNAFLFGRAMRRRLAPEKVEQDETVSELQKDQEFQKKVVPGPLHKHVQKFDSKKG